MIRLYGVTGNSSLGRVTSGIRGALEELGLLAGYVPVSEYDEDASYPGYDAPISVYVGRIDNSHWPASIGKHEKRYAILAPNSSWLPSQLLQKLHEFHGVDFVSPSTWGAYVIARHVPQQKTVTVWHHGVDAGFAPSQADHRATVRSFEAGRFEVLHMASTTAQRKGTRELIDGWANAVRAKELGAKPLLRIIVNGAVPTVPRDVEDTIVVSTAPHMNLTVEKAAALYRAHHVVCQPSRAEGWGLGPVESRACGVPVVATDCTGHVDHARWMGGPGAVVVPTGEDAPIDDGPGAYAPSLAAADVQASLVRAFVEWPMLVVESMIAADAARAHWSWTATTKRWLASLEGETNG